MALINFPLSPTLNQEYTFEGRTWLWNGSGWELKLVSAPVGATGPQGATGATGVQGATGPIGVETGTVMLFAQTTAPTGWTKITTHNDKALRVVSGAAGSGGTTAFTSVFASRTPAGTVGNTTLTSSQMPSHAHAVINQSPNSGGLRFFAGGSLYYGFHDTVTTASTSLYTLNIASTLSAQVTNNGTGNTGGGTAHNHGFTGTAMDFAVQYVDIILASKD